MKKVFGAVVAAAMLAGCQARPVFSQQDIDRAELGKGLGAGFLLGTATAAHQVEGGQDNNWTEWERTPLPDGSHRIHDGSVSGIADDMWNRFESDVTLMKRLGTNSYRLSVEWSRLEPQEGVWNDEAANRYLSWMQTLRANGIIPMVTLYHWTLPKWVAAQGGWENDKTIADFAAFSGRVAAKLGAHVDLWCTLNEPNVYMTQSYIKAVHPPGKADQKLAAEVLNRLMEAHAKSVKAVRDNDTTDADGDGKATQVGIAHHLRVFQPSSSSMMDSMIAGLTDDFFNESFITAHRTGRVELHIP
ncbi:MAG TPA: family 1 glycosylhydrolase, partial [Myxococcaceae bacterium]|nr:family 1 glycosylhydrolase [Myxococcaceae bacterium]